MLFKILTKTVAVERLLFVKSPLSRKGKGKLRIYVSIGGGGGRKLDHAPSPIGISGSLTACLVIAKIRNTQMSLLVLRSFIASKFAYLR